MAEIKTGWTRKFPMTLGDYWLRFTDPPSDVCIVEVNNRGVFQAGVVGDIRNRVAIDECEWLGPLSPSDAEQLSELRKALISIERSAPGCECEYDNEYCCAVVKEFCARCWAHIALNPKHQEEKETE